MLIKLLILALAAYGIWRLWRQIAVPPHRDDNPESARHRAPPRGGSAVGGIEDMTKCPVCRTYVGASAAACGRQDCPRRG
jgi:hypothetical protein